MELVNSSESIIICNFVFVRCTQGILLADNVRVLLSKFRSSVPCIYMVCILNAWRIFSNWKFRFIQIVMVFMYLFEIISSIWIFKFFANSHVQIWNYRLLKLKSLSRLYDGGLLCRANVFWIPCLTLHYPISMTKHGNNHSS